LSAPAILRLLDTPSDIVLFVTAMVIQVMALGLIGLVFSCVSASGHASQPIVSPARRHLRADHETRGPNQWEARSWKRMLLVPERKLMFCFIEKNACSQFNGLFNELNGVETDHLYFSSGALDHFNWTQADIEDALQDHSWYKGIFLRDPMERLVSAFVSKCVPDSDGTLLEGGGSSCLFFEKTVSEGAPPSFPEFVAGMALKVGDPQDAECAWGQPLGCEKPKASDPHFMPQTKFCGGVDIDDYDYVGDLESDMNVEVKRMLMEAGMADKLMAVDRYFPKGYAGGADALARPNHKLSHASDPAVLTQYYEDQATVDLAHHIYKADYALFEEAGHHAQEAQMPL